MNAFIKLLYSLLVAASVTTFVGVAIFSFYQPPKAPDYSDYFKSTNNISIADTTKAQAAYDAAYKTYNAKQKSYQRNVTYIVLALSILSTAAGLYLLKGSEVLGEGLALGGIALSVYAIITASIADSRPLRFVAVTLLLASSLLLAQRRFALPKATKI